MSIALSLAEVPHPGEFIKEEIDARGWAQRDLAFILGVPEQAVNMIISGKRGISPDMAKSLGKAFDVSAEYFANLQKAHEMAGARAPDPAIERRARLQEAYPIREIIRRGWFEDTDIDLLEAQVRRFFGVNRLDDVPCLAHAARKSDYSETTALQFAWLFRVRQVSAEMVVPVYSAKKLRTFVDDEMHRLTVDPEEVRHVSRLLGDCGVRLLFVETLPKAAIDGVCFWLDKGSPVIGMSVRHDRIDNFWFVLRHEIEHVLQKDGQKQPLSADLVDVDVENLGSEVTEREARANSAAANFCVPQEALESFFLRKFPYISERDTLGFARRIQRHPGIVVGQLQKKMDRYDWLSRHKVRVRQYLLGNSTFDGWGVPAAVSL